MINMQRFLFVLAGVAALISVLLISGCSDQYRYPCQDPANQTSKECNPPICEADEVCVEYLLEQRNESKS